MKLLSGYSPRWIPRMASILPCCLPYGKSGELPILCCWGFEPVFALRATPRQGKKLRLHPQTPWLWSPPVFATLGAIHHYLYYSQINKEPVPFILLISIKIWWHNVPVRPWRTCLKNWLKKKKIILPGSRRCTKTFIWKTTDKIDTSLSWN